MKRRLLVAAAVVGILAVLPFVASFVSKARRPRIAAALLERGEVSSRPSAEPGPIVRATWTGVAGLRVEVETPLQVPVDKPKVPQPVTTLLFDPYATRHGWAELVRPIDTDEQTAVRAFPKAEAIFVSHSHHDHLADVAFLAVRTGAHVYGTRTTCALARAMGVRGDRCVVVRDGEHLRFGFTDVEVVETAHGRTSGGVPFDGTIDHQEWGRPYVWEMKMGGALAFIVRANGRVLYHQASAGLTEAQLARVKGLKPDLAFVGVALADGTPEFAERLLGALQPRRVAAMHWDDFFGGLLDDDPPRLGQADLEGFEARAKKLLGDDAVLRPKPFQALVFAMPPPEQVAQGIWTGPVPLP